MDRLSLGGRALVANRLNREPADFRVIRRRSSFGLRRPWRETTIVPAGERGPKQEGPSRMSIAKKTAQRQGFKTGEAIVYPAHGVGRITAIEEQEIAGFKLELFVVAF